MADRLAGILARLGIPLSQARALDLIARICGLPDWARMRSGLIRLEGAQVPASDHALTRILRLDAPDPALTLRAVEAVWFAHLTDHELADPVLPAARKWLRAALGASHAWAVTQRTPLTPDLIASSLEAGTGCGYRQRPGRTPIPLPKLLDLQLWAISERISAPWAVRLTDCLVAIPGYDPAGLVSGHPLSERFRRAAGDRMRLTMGPVRDLIDEVRMEARPDLARIG